jgi:hypothetical protein
MMERKAPASRSDAMIHEPLFSIVAKRREFISRADRGLKPTAKVNHRYAMKNKPRSMARLNALR